MVDKSLFQPEYQCPSCCRSFEIDATQSCHGCRVGLCCNQNDQLTDKLSHQTTCFSIQKAQNEIDKEFNQLQTRCYQCFNDPEAVPDHFWEWRDIRSYIQAQHRFVLILCRISTKPALRTAIDHSLDILRLDPGDNLDVRFLVPNIMIRLGLNQQAYEFIRRYRQVSPACQYAWAHLDLVLPEPKRDGANENHALTDWLDDCVPLPFKAALTLIALRLLFCLRDLKHANVLRSRLPPELVRIVRDNLIVDGVVFDSELCKEVRGGGSVRNRISDLEKEINGLFDAVNEQDPIFWIDLSQRWAFIGAANRLALEQSRASWVETTGALNWLEAKLRTAN